jgi:5-methylthioribose kinase
MPDPSMPDGILHVGSSDAGDSTATIVSFLRCAGLVSDVGALRLSALTGGVASDIWKVETIDRTFVVKRARARLRVAQEWTAPVSRNASEVAWMRTAAAVVPGAVPRILADDPSVGAFAMEFLDPRDFPVWKSELAQGRVDVEFAANVGRAVAAIHAATAQSESVAQTFANDTVFHSIRLEPYLEATARAHPDLATPLMALSRETLATKIALVHGDVSPKNILVGRQGPIFLDAECAWFGDPAFDLAFCLNHFLLKGARDGADKLRYEASFAALARAYLAGVDWEEADGLEARAAALLPALFLARIDGKSPVEYLTREGERETVRCCAAPLIAAPPRRLIDVARAWSAV